MKTIITIGRQFGSGGKEIGIRVAKELGIPFYDKELLQEAAKKSGLCQKICPAQAIRLENRKPVWVKEKCILCLGCLHRCPRFAIQYGKHTQAHGQYVNPHVKL